MSSSLNDSSMTDSPTELSMTDSTTDVSELSMTDCTADVSGLSMTDCTADVSGLSCDSGGQEQQPDQRQPLLMLCTNLTLPPSWNCQTPTETCVRFYKLLCIPSTSKQPVKISHTITVNSDLTWNVFVHNHEVKSDCSALQTIPQVLDINSLKKLIELVNKLQICAGHPDSSFLSFCRAKKGKFTSKDGHEVAHIDSYLPIRLNGQIYPEAIRTTACEILVTGLKCVSCKNYRRTIRLLYNRWQKRSSDSTGDSSSCHTNDRYLNTPEKILKINSLRKRVRKAESELKKLKEKVSTVIEQSDEVDPQVHADMVDVMNENRRFFHMHKSRKGGVVYKTKNIYADDDRSIYFISDPPHLVKTVRNCWSHSYGRYCTREMLVS